MYASCPHFNSVANPFYLSCPPQRFVPYHLPRGVPEKNKHLKHAGCASFPAAAVLWGKCRVRVISTCKDRLDINQLASAVCIYTLSQYVLSALSLVSQQSSLLVAGPRLPIWTNSSAGTCLSSSPFSVIISFFSQHRRWRALIPAGWLPTRWLALRCNARALSLIAWGGNYDA